MVACKGWIWVEKCGCGVVVRWSFEQVVRLHATPTHAMNCMNGHPGLAGSLWRIDYDVGCVASLKLRLVPGTAALLIGQSAHNLRYAACRRGVNDGADYSRCYDGRGCDCGSCCNGVIAATSTVIAAAVAAVNVDVDIAIDVYVLIDVYVTVDVGVLVDVGVAVLVDVGIAVLVGIGGTVLVGAGIGGAILGTGVAAVLTGAPAGAVDTGLGAAPRSAAATCATTTAASASTSALSEKCHSRDEDGDGEYSKDLS